MRRMYPVPLEIRDEEKIIGNRFSMRQVATVGAGLLAGLMVGLPVFAGATALGASRPLAVGLAAIPFPVTVGVAFAFAFLPAGWMEILPGPENPVSPDPYDPPLRLDQWLRIWRGFRAKPKHLPFRRPGYTPAPALLFRDPAVKEDADK